MFILLVQVTVKTARVPEFRVAIETNARLSVERETECLRFDVNSVEGVPNRFVFYEVYTSEGAWLAHRETPHFLAYKAAVDEILETRELMRLAPVWPGHLPKSSDGL